MTINTRFIIWRLLYSSYAQTGYHKLGTFEAVEPVQGTQRRRHPNLPSPQMKPCKKEDVALGT